VRPFDAMVVDAALHHLGKPYIWGGHGTSAWTPTGLVSMQSFAGCPEAYDCAGLVTTSIFEATIGKTDWRNSHNAQTLYDMLPPAVPGEAPDSFRLRFYGSGDKEVVHIAFQLGAADRMLILQAGGGGSSTTSYAEAVRRGACVSLGHTERGDYLGSRSINAVPH
jgi:hypothetical protein